MSETQTQLVPLPVSTLKSSAFELSLLDAEGQVQQTWSLATRELTLGSYSGADLQLSDPSVSRQHALIQVDELGHRVTDLDSKNGLWVNGVRVRDAYLNEGALLRLGRVQLRYSLREDQPVEHHISMSAQFGRLVGESAKMRAIFAQLERVAHCLLYTSPSPRDRTRSRMPSSA